MRKNISSNSPYESIVGYSRAVKIGNIIEVSGTVASDGSKVVGKDNEYEQTKFIIKKIETALVDAGASLMDVVRTRIYVKNIANWEAVAKAHREIFYDIKPASTMVEVNKLISDDFLVEIEATAILDNV